MKIQVFGQGGLEYVPFAKNKIRQMTEQRTVNKLPSLKKTLPLGNNIYAQLTASEFGDSIRITQGEVSLINADVANYTFMDLGVRYIDTSLSGGEFIPLPPSTLETITVAAEKMPSMPASAPDTISFTTTLHTYYVARPLGYGVQEIWENKVGKPDGKNHTPYKWPDDFYKNNGGIWTASNSGVALISENGTMVGWPKLLGEFPVFNAVAATQQTYYAHRLKPFSDTPITIEELKERALLTFRNGAVVVIVGYEGESYFTYNRNDTGNILSYTGSNFLDEPMGVTVLESFIIENESLSPFSITDTFYVPPLNRRRENVRHYDLTKFAGLEIAKSTTGAENDTQLTNEQVQSILNRSANDIENNTVFYLIQKNSIQQVFYAFKISKENDTYTTLGESEADFFISQGSNIFILTGNNQMNDNNGLFELWNYVKKLF